MREMILLPMVVALCLAGVAQPRIAICGYVWFSLMRPDLLSYAADRPYSVALAIATLAGSLRFLPQILSIMKSPIVLGLLALQVLIGLSVFTAVVPAYSYGPWILYLKMIAVIGLIPLLIQTKEWISWLIQVMAFSIGFLSLKYGVFSVISGGARFNQGLAGGLLADNNNLALVFVCATPLCWFARGMTPFRPVRWMFTAMAVFSIAAVVSSYSRGAAVALAVVVLWIGFRSRHKIAVAALFLVLALGAVFLVGETYLDRLATIKAPTEEISALGRMEYARAAIRMWQDYPVFGVGFGMTNQTWLLKNYTSFVHVNSTGSGPGQVIHNTYLQMLTDSGTFAFLIYVGLVLGTIRWLAKSAASHRKRKTGLDMYPTALEVTLVGFAVGSVFLSRVHFDLIYMLLMAAASWNIYEKNSEAAAAQITPWQPARPAALPERAVRQAPRRPGANEVPGMTTARVTRINHQI